MRPLQDAGVNTSVAYLLHHHWQRLGVEARRLQRSSAHAREVVGAGWFVEELAEVCSWGSVVALRGASFFHDRGRCMHGDDLGNEGVLKICLGSFGYTGCLSLVSNSFRRAFSCMLLVAGLLVRVAGDLAPRTRPGLAHSVQFIAITRLFISWVVLPCAQWGCQHGF